MSSKQSAVSSIAGAGPRIGRRVFYCSLLTCSLLTVSFAHTYPYSTLELHLTSHGLEGTLQGHVNSFAHPVGAMNMTNLLDEQFVRKNLGKFAEVLNCKEGIEVVADSAGIRGEVPSATVNREKQQITLKLRYPWKRKPSRLDFAGRLFIAADPSHETYLRLYDGDELTQRTFTYYATTFTYWRGTRQAKWAVFRAYVRDGIHHIFTGYDHIAFIIGLLLLGGSIVKLTKIVTAFTLAHSITLTLAALAIVNLSPKFTEPAIALSIAYIGADNLVAGEGRDWRAWLAFFFGFIHGFGFANVLRETGLPQHAVGLSLFSFNLGVEIGQVCIVLLVAPVLAAIRARNGRIASRLVTVGSGAIVLAGGYWFVQRMWFAG